MIRTEPHIEARGSDPGNVRIRTEPHIEASRIETGVYSQKVRREWGRSKSWKHRKGKDDHKAHTKQRPSGETITKTKGILLGIAAAAVIWIRQQRGRPRQKTTGPGKAGRLKKERRHHRISNKIAITLVLALLTAPCQSQTPGDVIRQAGVQRDHNPSVVSRSPQQQLTRLINNGLQYSRAITRVASDTPISIATRAQTAQNTPRHIQQEMERLTGEGWNYSRAATRSVASDRLPVCMERTPTTSAEEAKDQNPHRGKRELSCGLSMLEACQRRRVWKNSNRRRSSVARESF
jgi:hypothetical protein